MTVEKSNKPKKSDGSPLTELYKYRSLAGASKEHVKDILLKNRLYFTNPNDFNDPFDCKPILSKSIGEVNERAEKEKEKAIEKALTSGKTSEQAKKAGEKQHDKIQDTWKDPRKRKKEFEKEVAKIGICSFCEEGDNILLWSYYADSHRGVCLEFSVRDENDEYFLLNYKRDPRKTAPLSVPLPIEYKDTRPTLKIPFSQTLLSRINQKTQAYFMEDKKGRKVITRKAARWRKENEQRVYTDAANGDRFRFYREACLTGVILGTKISLEDALLVITWVSERNKKYGTNTKLYRAKPGINEYKVVIQKSPLLSKGEEFWKVHRLTRRLSILRR